MLVVEILSLLASLKALSGQQALKDRIRLCKADACQHRGYCMQEPATTANLQPSFVMINISGRPCKEQQYNLLASSSQELVVKGQSHGSYQMVAVLMYSGGHFFTDMFDPREQRWLRYDGMAPHGRASAVEPPTGRVDGGCVSFFPEFVVYARKPDLCVSG